MIITEDKSYFNTGINPYFTDYVFLHKSQTPTSLKKELKDFYAPIFGLENTSECNIYNYSVCLIRRINQETQDTDYFASIEVVDEMNKNRMFYDHTIFGLDQKPDLLKYLNIPNKLFRSVEKNILIFCSGIANAEQITSLIKDWKI